MGYIDIHVKLNDMKLDTRPKFSKLMSSRSFKIETSGI